MIPSTTCWQNCNGFSSLCGIPSQNVSYELQRAYIWTMCFCSEHYTVHSVGSSFESTSWFILRTFSFGFTFDCTFTFAFTFKVLSVSLYFHWYFRFQVAFERHFTVFHIHRVLGCHGREFIVPVPQTSETMTYRNFWTSWNYTPILINGRLILKNTGKLRKKGRKFFSMFSRQVFSREIVKWFQSGPAGNPAVV